jgi:hypothetical protein
LRVSISIWQNAIMLFKLKSISINEWTDKLFPKNQIHPFSEHFNALLNDLWAHQKFEAPLKLSARFRTLNFRPTERDRLALKNRSRWSSLPELLHKLINYLRLFKFPMSGWKIEPQSPRFVHHRSNDRRFLLSHLPRCLLHPLFPDLPPLPESIRPHSWFFGTSQYDRSLSFVSSLSFSVQLLVSSFRNDSEDFNVVPHHPLWLLSNEARGKRAKVSSLLNHFCSPRQEAAVKKFTSWRNITVCHIERCERIIYSVEGLSGQSDRNEFSIDWERYVTSSDSPSKVFNSAPDLFEPVSVSHRYHTDFRSEIWVWQWHRIMRSVVFHFIWTAQAIWIINEG